MIRSTCSFVNADLTAGSISVIRPEEEEDLRLGFRTLGARCARPWRRLPEPEKWNSAGEDEGGGGSFRD